MDFATTFRVERDLNDVVTRLANLRSGKIAVHIHLSRLQKHHRQPYHIRIATDMFEGAVNALGGRFFALRNADLIFITDSTDLLQLEAAVARQRSLFADDPLIADDKVDAALGVAASSAFCSWYRLDEDYPAFAAVCREFFLAAEKSRTLMLQEAQLRETRTQLQPIAPAEIGRLEEALARADLGNMIRRQAVCTALPGQKLQRIFDEYFVSIGDLRDVMSPKVDLTGNRWLFQYLTRALDLRMLSHVTHEMTAQSGKAFSINLNVQTLLSPEFQKFDAQLSSATRSKLVIELQLLDIFADLSTYIFARDYLQERGYRICLDGLTHVALRYVDRARLGADLVKLYWTPDGVNTLAREHMPQFRDLVVQTGQARIILCRTEDQEALDLGREAGIIMFQGRFIERMYIAQREQSRHETPTALPPRTSAAPTTAGK